MGKTSKISNDSIEEILNKIRLGQSAASISEELDIHINTVRKYAKENGLNFKSKKVASDYHDIIIRLHSEGKKCQEISEVIGMGYSTVRKYIAQIGLPGDRDRKHTQDLENVKTNFFEGCTVEDLSRLCNIHPDTVKKCLEELNINILQNKLDTIKNVEFLEPHLYEGYSTRQVPEEHQKDFLIYEIKKMIYEKGSYLSRAEATQNSNITDYYLAKWKISIPDINKECGLINRGSVFEAQVEKYFIEHNINYETQKKFDDCVYKKPLPFDFYLTDYNVLVECDGKQHTDSSSKWYSDEQIIRDNIKNEWCKSHNITMIRIPYKRIANSNYISTYLTSINKKI